MFLQSSEKCCNVMHEQWHVRLYGDHKHSVLRVKTSSANVPHLNVWGFDISAAEFPQQTRVFVCCGNSAADISKPHTFKWGTLADDVFPSANFTLPPKPRPPTVPI